MRKGPKQTHIGSIARQIQRQYTGQAETLSRDAGRAFPGLSSISKQVVEFFEQKDPKEIACGFLETTASGEGDSATVFDFCGGLDTLSPYLGEVLSDMELGDIPPQAFNHVRLFLGGGINSLLEFIASTTRSWIVKYKAFPSSEVFESWEVFLAGELLPLSEFSGDLGRSIRITLADCVNPFDFHDDGKPFVPDSIRPLCKANFQEQMVGDRDESTMKEILTGHCPARRWLNDFFKFEFALLVELYKLLHEELTPEQEKEYIDTLDGYISEHLIKHLFIAEVQRTNARKIAATLGAGREYPKDEIEAEAVMLRVVNKLTSPYPIPTSFVKTLVMFAGMQVGKTIKP